MKKGLFMVLAAGTFSLGTLGIFLPFLPTTVFYLVTGFLLLRSSDKLYGRFIASDNYRKYVEEPIIRKNISTGNMIKMFIGIFFVFLIPFLMVDNFVMRVTLGIVYTAHVIFLTWHLKFRGKSPSQKNIGETDD